MGNRWSSAVVFTTLLLLLGGGAWWLIRHDAGNEGEVRASLSAAAAMSGTDTAGYARATEPWTFRFPEDYGPHPEFRTEWWYLTGNLRQPADGRRFAYQLTFFRNALSPEGVGRASAWDTNQLWMAHLAITDVASDMHVYEERFARGAAGLAGAEADPLEVWLEDWAIVGSAGETFPLSVQARKDGWALNLSIREGKPPVLQGDEGLSRKGPSPGDASYYVSLTRLPTTGTLTVEGVPLEVEGNSWMDREWSTSALGEEHLGWDWFSLQLEDGREIMFFELRRRDGKPEPLNHGSLVEEDGSYRSLAADDVEMQVLATWASPLDGTEYPSGWEMRIPALDLDLTLEPMVQNQEMNLSVRYWEGAISVTGRDADGPVQGVGFAELTGYGESPGGGGQGLSGLR